MLDIQSNQQKNQGFTLIESMVVLFLLSLVIITTISTIRIVQMHTEAKRLAEQTTTFAKIFASYINKNYETIKNNIKTTSNLAYSPTDLIASNNWKANTSTVNLYNQTPCITLRKNPHSNDIEAIMFYTATEVDKSILK